MAQTAGDRAGAGRGASAGAGAAASAGTGGGERPGAGTAPGPASATAPTVVEGATTLFAAPTAGAVPSGAPGRIDPDRPFYNPGMALNRDLSVLLVAAWAARRGREIDFADALCGVGARSLRVARESGAPVVVHANDGDPAAVAAVARGAQENGVAARVRTTRSNAHAFLSEGRFDVVDVDPFGSPAVFLDAAVRACRHDGLVCVTATDTAALTGGHPRACLRRYGGRHALHAMPWRAEVGLRILAGAVVRVAAAQERAAEPVLSVASGHWMRVVARVRHGAGLADAAVARLGFAYPEEGLGRLVPAAQAVPVGAPWAGPLWTGPLHEPALAADLAARAAAPPAALARPVQTRRLLELVAQEAEAPAFWIDPDRLRTRFGSDAPRRDDLVARLRAAGHRAARTHLDPKGVRTDADLDALAAAWTGPRGGGAARAAKP